MEVAAVLLTLAVVGFVVLPLLRGDRAPLEGDEDISESESRKRVTLRALRDVEYDFDAGKLDREDYLRLRDELSREALRALEAAGEEEGDAGRDADGIRTEPSAAEAVEEEIRRLRLALREGTLCRACGRENRRGSRFCGGCGRPLPGDEASGSERGGPAK